MLKSSDKEQSPKYAKCAYPDCIAKVIPNQSGKVELCPKHFEQFKFILWVVQLISAQSGKEEISKSGLYIPRR